jgi:hypothetical protein
MYQMSQTYGCSGCNSRGGNGGSSYGSFSSGSYSRLESLTHASLSYSCGSISYAPSPEQKQAFAYAASAAASDYGGNFASKAQECHPEKGFSADKPGSSYHSNSLNYQLFQTLPNYNFVPDNFLKPGKLGMFVGKAEEIRGHIERAFEEIFHKPFPNDIKISVCDEEQFRKIAPHPGTLGLSLNRSQQGLLSEIFVKNDFLARVMLTIGHELGHVLSAPLENPQDEEAKAYAFSLAWIRMVKEKDIAGLKEAIITERPAENGLHNVAFAFVERLMRRGKSAWEVYLDLIRKMVCLKGACFEVEFEAE